MEGRNRWLGYVAIGLGLLALLVALAGRLDGPGRRGGPPAGDFRGPVTLERSHDPAQPNATPSPQPNPQQPNAQRQGGSRSHDFRGGWDREAPPAWGSEPREGFQRGFGPHMGFFFGPWMLLRGLRDTLVALVLIAIGWRLFRGRRGPANGSGGSPPAGPAGGPAAGPSTGETTRL